MALRKSVAETQLFASAGTISYHCFVFKIVYSSLTIISSQISTSAQLDHTIVTRMLRVQTLGVHSLAHVALVSKETAKFVKVNRKRTVQWLRSSPLQDLCPWLCFSNTFKSQQREADQFVPLLKVSRLVTAGRQTKLTNWSASRCCNCSPQGHCWGLSTVREEDFLVWLTALSLEVEHRCPTKRNPELTRQRD